ncbi:MAG: ABC transporter permease [Chromatiaceae bacterium]|nr:ABC transporter permease [Chromatiaceae bacterium]
MARSGARRQRSLHQRTRPAIWLAQHLASARDALCRLLRTPLPTAMTIAVIGISLALPAALYVLTGNLRLMVSNWDETAAISLFLRQEVDDATAATLAERLRERPELEAVRLIGREQALREFRELGGFEGAFDQLEDNPLPALLAIYPRNTQPEDLERLSAALLELPEADFARMDSLWLQRLRAILALSQRAVFIFAALLGLGVLLIVGNTIRLEILNRRIDIEIMELVGATAAFVRRPFLYAGAWYGLLGGLGAWLLVTLLLSLLQGPVSRLAELYGASFRLAGLDALALLLVVGGSVLLGLTGSWIAVERHLRGAHPV